MKNISPALYLYCIFGFIYIIAALCDIELLVFVSKPIMASSITFYYMQEVNYSYNSWKLLFLLIYFWSGILNLFEDSLTLYYVMVLNMIGYLILIYLTFRDIKLQDLKNLNQLNVIFLSLTVFLLLLLSYVCLGLIFSTNSSLYWYVLVYVLVLIILIVNALLLFFQSHSKEVVFLILATFCYLVCDLFYVLYYYYYDFIFFRSLSIIGTSISYYFIVNYFISKDKNLSL
jgi:hypothetical protein